MNYLLLSLLRAKCAENVAESVLKYSKILWIIKWRVNEYCYDDTKRNTIEYNLYW